MKTFDFTHPDFLKQSPARRKFLQENYDKPITLAEYVRVVSEELPRKGKRPTKRHCPSAARLQYNRLVKNYGFFPGGQR